ncbi:MerR family transcriptional regulator [Enterocloster lavalensis]|uniref:MerR family transcriptional regulator n=1 Tax=Enterocloster lavalensis TaxID=460384 RepID=UPI002666BE34|nr:MerR family transcriptional regulator [Enterocloster lavalensis]
MKTYRTAQVAQIIGIHPNTVRLYEELGLISRPERRANGYRVFTDLHIAQFCLARTALRVEVLQNGLRANAVEIVKASAAGEFDRALLLTGRYEETLKSERENAEEALRIAGEILSGAAQEDGGTMMTRKEAAACLQVTADTLRNWELNGLLTVKRRQNGYRVYSAGDIRRLRIIRALRCANYSLAAILRMLSALTWDPAADIRQVLDTPGEDEGVISVCDRLITSLDAAIRNAGELRDQLNHMKMQF